MMNFIIGDNGIGKTNILEAIYLLSTGKSFRTSQLTDLIQHQTSSFYIEASLVKENTSHTLKIGYDGKKKHIHFNNTLLPAFSHLLGIMPSVLYSPKDIGIIIGTPLERRRFLNIYLGQSDPLYAHHLIRYTKALEHRNMLLKAKKIFPANEIVCFEKELALSAVYLMESRIAALALLTEKIALLIPHLVHQEERFILQYLSSFALEGPLSAQPLEEQYQRMRHKEALFGISLVGPHRDDFTILFNDLPVKSFCSEGQKRSFLSALKLAEWELLKESSHQLPLLCIDDLGIHLDATRESLLEKQLQNLSQVLITSPKKPTWNDSSEGSKVFETFYQK